MSYQAIDQLVNDATFAGRNRAAALQQAETFKDDGRPDIAATARDVLRDVGSVTSAFNRLAAAGPGIGDKADNGDGTIDQAKITDADLLSLTQANFPTVADLFYADDGAPI
jgi:hypothetical protein